jgi:GTP-binding protein EngB required for normal cell division
MANFLKFLISRIKPAAGTAAGGPHAPEHTSRLLSDVLGSEAASAPSAPSVEENLGAVPLSQRLSVGARLDDERSRTLDAAQRLIALSDTETAHAVEILVHELQNHACCVAFVGQVKAGKSTLINVLVEKQDLLPSDINPWTTVITRLHFGIPGKPQSGAAFTFFNQDEWRRLSVGGRTRELTGQLFPDFDWQALNAQVEDMQERARRKLGPRFEELLGTEHFFADVEPGLLNRYVGAGDPHAESPAAGGEGEYADITKLADVFLDLGAFSFPTILIDTPGVNDPFLVRDEITRQNLEAADMCVIVLTARQPLSIADLGLIRTLRGLKKDRLIVFVNKIDEIGGGDEVLQEVSRRITATLNQEFPSAQIPIVPGSAIWARKALSAGIADSGMLDGLTVGPDGEAVPFEWPGQAEIAEDLAADTVFRASGLPALAVAISEMMQEGPVAGAIGTAASLLDAVGRNLISWHETGIEILDAIAAGSQAGKSGLSNLMSLREALAAEFGAFFERLIAIRAEQLQELGRSLGNALQLSIGDSLTTLPAQQAIMAQASQIDARVRLKLESVFLAAVEDASRLINGEQDRFRDGVARLFMESSLNNRPQAIPGRSSALSPSLIALSEPASLGLAGTLSGVPLTAEIESAQLSEMMQSSFQPITGLLVEEAARVLKQQSDSMIGQVQALTIGPLDSLIQLLSKAIEEGAGPSEDAASERHALAAKIEALRKILSDLVPVLKPAAPTHPPAQEGEP